MEFPSMGIRCSVSSCKQLDFLPFTCSYCEAIFCKEHFHVAAHACSKFQDNVVSTTGPVSYYHCSDKSCNNNSPVQIPCVKCKLHFCISHRHHGCLDAGEEEKSNELKRWNKPKQEFSRAKATVDKQVNDSLKKAKNSTVANKVQLMRLKGRATGPSGIPNDERRYFLVYPPVTGSSKNNEPKAAYTCLRWSLGRTIDSFAETLGVKNMNNSSKGEKLRLFRKNNGTILSERMDITISDLLNDGSALTDGESLILEYSDNSYVDNNLYK